MSSLNNKGKEVFLLGDLNINLLNYNTDNLTSDYLDTLFELGFMPLITKPTQVTSTPCLYKHIAQNIRFCNLLGWYYWSLSYFLYSFKQLPLTNNLIYYRDLSVSLWYWLCQGWPTECWHLTISADINESTEQFSTDCFESRFKNWL